MLNGLDQKSEWGGEGGVFRELKEQVSSLTEAEIKEEHRKR